MGLLSVTVDYKYLSRTWRPLTVSMRAGRHASLCFSHPFILLMYSVADTFHFQPSSQSKTGKYLQAETLRKIPIDLFKDPTKFKSY